MRISLFSAILVMLFGVSVMPAQAAIITLSPSAAVLNVGDSVFVDIELSDLGEGTAPSVGVYDFDIEFDGAVLGFVGASFSSELDLFGFGSLQILDDSLAGLINLFELSFDLAADLDDFQSLSFVAATLEFAASAPGVSDMALSVNALGDGLGDPIAVSAINDTQITVQSPVTDVSAPGALSLMIIGLGAIAVRARSAGARRG